MNHQSFCYHTRLATDNRIKTGGGTFSGPLDATAIARLASTYDVQVTGSGRLEFVDKQGRPVSLYVQVDPSETVKGVAALSVWRAVREKERRAACALAEAQQEEIDEIMGGLSHDEIVRRLKGE
jgi:hypothetical protein